MIRWITFGSLVATLVCACSSQPSLGPDPSAGEGQNGGPDATASDGAAPLADSSPAPGTDATSDGSSPPDASSDGPASGCGEFAGDGVFTCSKDGNSRGKCVGDASASVEACPRGCLREPPGQDSVCMGTTASFDCTGTYGTKKADNGDYYITAFGCWIDDAGVEHTDPGDNCIPTCLDKAKAAGLCDANGTGKACEEKINWFTADGARFGCLARLRITNPQNGKSVIALALDYGPACSVENSVSKAVLDASGRIDRLLFGADQGASDRSLVHVVEVDDSLPLGPVP